MLRVPERFSRNSPSGRAWGPPEESGAYLLKQMAERLGLADLADTSVLDFGCGVRFTQAIVNLALPVKRYVGIDVWPEMVTYLQENVLDPRVSIRLMDMPGWQDHAHGPPMTNVAELPLGAERFDVACMFSVITHHPPESTAAILGLLRRYVLPGGRLFFTASLDDAIDSFDDRVPDQPGLECFYHPDHLHAIVHAAGWRVDSVEPPDSLMQHSFACTA